MSNDDWLSDALVEKCWQAETDQEVKWEEVKDVLRTAVNSGALIPASRLERLWFEGCEEVFVLDGPTHFKYISIDTDAEPVYRILPAPDETSES